MRAYWLALLLPLSLAAQADDRVKERILDNGLKVIIKEDHRAPIVTSGLLPTWDSKFFSIA